MSGHPVIGDAEVAYGGVIEHAGSSGRNRAHRELLVARHPQLADREHVKRRAECLRDGGGDWDAPTRQAQHDHAGVTGEMEKATCEDRTGGPAVVIGERHHEESLSSPHVAWPGEFWCQAM